MAPVRSATAMNPLKSIGEFGQSIWFDYIRRDLMASGQLKRLIEEDGLRGMTSNPTIFEKAFAGGADYAQPLRELQARKDLTPMRIYETLAIKDIQDAARALRPVYDNANGRDGFVSLECSPYLARDGQGTLAEARRLWQAVGRENLMIKIPGTAEGIPAVEQAIADGINVNITLLFAQDVYEKVAWAYIAGLEKRAKAGADISRVASVASFFVSRIDTAVDAMLKDKQLLGKAAIANAKLAYQIYKKILKSPRWKALAAKGAQPQRLLWASTGVKNPAYRDVMYIEELIGPDTVNTVPPATLDAFRDHGRPRRSIEEDVDEAAATMKALAKAGIKLKDVTDKLLHDGLKAFADSFDKLLSAVDATPKLPAGARLNAQSWKLPDAAAKAVQAETEDWTMTGKVRRLWSGDAALWSGADEAAWLGWLRIVDEQIAALPRLLAFQEEVRAGGYSHALLLGMGGSSLGPEVLRMTFGRIKGFPELLVLDSTDPAQIKAFEKKLDLKKTLFIVSSKSGSTLEPNILKQYFFARSGRAGDRFIAVTDPGSKLEQSAKAEGFRHIFPGKPDIGGRYSILSNFGMVPAAAMGLDLKKFLERAREMVLACAGGAGPDKNPGAALGLALGTLGKAGRDKVTVIASPGIASLGSWLEQLIAESTGKEGHGLIPVDREPVGKPEQYGKDRVFVYLRLDASMDAAVAALEKAGQPVIRIELPDAYGLGQEFFRWEIATAVAGSVLGINPFNQPDVEASKVETRKLTDEYEKKGSLPAEKPFLVDKGIRLFAAKPASGGSIAGVLKNHAAQLKAGDYFALLAYIEMTPAHEKLLTAIRTAVRDRKKTATCVGFGPRFLHSTGQAYKGGPNSGVFLQITCDESADLSVPGQKYTFGVVKAAQARGDFAVLVERKRRALRIHLGKDVAAGLELILKAVS